MNAPTHQANSPRPTVSVVIPTKNRCDLLMETLASLRNQDYPDWEVVVIDDGSEDATLTRLAAIRAEDDRIRFAARTGDASGAPVCRNQGVSAARGDYIVFLDSDDLLAPSCLGNRVQVLELNPDLDFAVFQASLFRQTPDDARSCWNEFTAEPDLERFLALDGVWGPCNPIWRRKTLEAIGPWDEQLPRWQDWDFHVRALIAPCTYRKFNTVDCHIRLMSPNRQTIGNSPHTDTTFAWLNHLVDKMDRLLADMPNPPDGLQDLRLGLRYFYFTRLASHHPADARAGWEQLRQRGQVSSWVYRSGRLYLSWMRNRFCRVALRHVLQWSWPAGRFTTFGSKTFLNGPMPDAGAGRPGHHAL